LRREAGRPAAGTAERPLTIRLIGQSNGYSESAPGVSGKQPTITEIECGEIRFVAHRELEAIELTVVDPAGRGFRTWIGADLAPRAALLFCAATVRLAEGITT
jgi:hypothetical protein